MSREWVVSRICEEFHCLPSAAIHEPLDLCLGIIECRNYARAKRLVEQSQSLDDLPDDPMIALVQEIQFDIAREARNKRVRKTAGKG